MKNGALKVWIEQVAGQIEAELATETNTNRVCDLMDAKEYLRRAWHTLDSSPVRPNATQAEMAAVIHGGEQ